MKYSAKMYAAALHDYLKDSGDKDLGKKIRAFLAMLQKNRSFKLLPKILKEFEKLESGRVIRVRSGKAVSESWRDRLKKAVGADTVAEEHAPELLGGAVIEWDDWRIDASLKGKISKLKASL